MQTVACLRPVSPMGSMGFSPQATTPPREGGPMSDARPTVMLIVRGLKSRLSHDELERRYRERMPQFRDVPGLLQKFYSYDS